MTTFSTTREIKASVEKVFAAFTDSNRLAKWWGPAGFTNTINQCEFKTGGRWSLIMHGPDGANYPNEYIFDEVVPMKKIVINHVQEPKFKLTITLAPSANAGSTQLTWDQAFENDEIAKRIEHIVVPANEQNLDKLAAEV